MTRTVVVFFCTIVVLGCSAKGTDGGGSGGRSGSSDAGARPPENTEDRCSDRIDNDRNGRIDCDESSCQGARGCGGAGITEQPDPTRPIDFAECATLMVQAEETTVPVDIVWVIDNSGSMSGEAAIVQENMNNFARTIEESGIDVRVVVMTEPGFVSVPAPLGADDSRFRFVGVDVQSHDGLFKLVEQYPMYQDFLRANSVLHFIAVTDDESERMTAEEFYQQMTALTQRSFTFHAIASEDNGCTGLFCFDGCVGPNGTAAAVGRRYYEVADMTGGRKFSICTPDWQSLFDQLSQAIAIPVALPCGYAVPTADDGQDVDPKKVNVIYRPGGQGEDVIPFAGGSSGTDCTSGGWYYDDPMRPTRILICPSTCQSLENDAEGVVEITLGCETLLI